MCATRCLWRRLWPQLAVTVRPPYRLNVECGMNQDGSWCVDQAQHMVGLLTGCVPCGGASWVGFRWASMWCLRGSSSH